MKEGRRDKDSNIDGFKDVVKAVRSVRANLNIKDRLKVEVKQLKDQYIPEQYILNMVNADISKVKEFSSTPAILFVTDSVEIKVLVSELDIDKEVDRLKRSLEKERIERDRVLKNLNSERFISKAPKEIVDREKRILEESNIKIEAIKRQANNLGISII